MEFRNQKSQRLGNVDLSRKGSIDEPIVHLIKLINSQTNYFTTSSCSGRIIVFESAAVDHIDAGEKIIPIQGKPSKKGCKWLFVSHSKVKISEVEESLCNVSDDAIFKFEAMVMHIQCQTLQDAQQIHQAAVASGFRNSGISVGSKGKIIVGVRSTHSLEAPLSKDGLMLVSSEYCKYLVECANKKMEENLQRIQRLYENLELLFTKSQSNSKDEAKKKRQTIRNNETHNKKHTRHHQSPNEEDTKLEEAVNVDSHQDDKDILEFGLSMFQNT